MNKSKSTSSAERIHMKGKVEIVNIQFLKDIFHRIEIGQGSAKDQEAYDYMIEHRLDLRG